MKIAARLATAGLIIALSGCAARGPVVSRHLPENQSESAVELAQTPFFPQRSDQCGPAALATVLGAAGSTTTPDALAPQVYLPERRGSLQPELLAATRRAEYIPYVLAPGLNSLLAELRAGHPVLVLQNLGTKGWPVWHYAVVIGFDAASDTVVLRSGEQRRKVMPAARFVRTWERADSWGMIALAPGELPAADDPLGYVRAVAGLEQAGRLQAARRAYRAGLARWPDHANLYLGLGNASYGLGKSRQAEEAYRQALAIAPDELAARNNLAQVLLDRGCPNAALQIVDATQVDGAIPISMRETIDDTRRQILRRSQSGQESARCTATDS